MNIIMILTNGFDPDVRVYKEAKYLVSKGHNVEILCWDRINRYPNEKQLILDNIKITRFFEYSEYGSGLKQIFSLFKFKKACKKYIKENNIKYDIMHCHDLDGMIIGKMISKRKDKIVFDMHEYYNTGAYQKIYPIVSIVLKFLQNVAYKIVHVNELQVKNISEKNKSKLVYLPNYPEMNNFKNINHVESDTLRITYAGYVRHFIPLTNLMKAANELDNVQVSIHGHGSGEEYEKIKDMAKTCKNVKLFGKYQNNEIAKFYENSDLIYVVYNKGNKNDENALPTKFFEAIASELPVIVSENSLLADTVEKYDIGFKVDGTNYESIKNVLQNIQNDKSILISKRKNIKNIPEKFSWEEIVKNLDDIYGKEENE